MGGWLALLLARALAARKGAAPIAGMVLIAPAVDFTEELMWKQFSDATKREIEQKGQWMRPSEYGEEAYPITRGLIEDGRKHLLLGGLIETGCPVHILQGVRILMCRGGTLWNWCRGFRATMSCSRSSRTATTGCRGRRTLSA